MVSLTYLIIAACAAVAWYTVNLARLEWGKQNRFGAGLIALLAAVAFLFPTILALSRS